jgi:hypothetical protein
MPPAARLSSAARSCPARGTRRERGRRRGRPRTAVARVSALTVLELARYTPAIRQPADARGRDAMRPGGSGRRSPRANQENLAQHPVSSPQPRGDDSGKKPQWPLGWARQYFLVFEFLAYLALFGYLGARLDARYRCEPWGLLGGLLLATAVGVYRMYCEGQKLEH